MDTGLLFAIVHKAFVWIAATMLHVIGILFNKWAHYNEIATSAVNDSNDKDNDNVCKL